MIVSSITIDMDIGTLVALIVVVCILIFSVAVSLNIGAEFEEIYRKIHSYIRRISIHTVVTISLIIGAVLLGIVASM